MARELHERGPGWDPGHPGVYQEIDASTGQVVSLEHVMHPYPDSTGEIWDSTSGTKGLFDIATRYVGTAAALFGIPSTWLQDLSGPSQADRVQLHWHPLTLGDPRNSFRVRRCSPGGDIDRSFVLLASLSVADTPLYGGQGLRVSGSLVPAVAAGSYVVRITGSVTTLPHQPDERTLQRFVPALDIDAWRASILSIFGFDADAKVADLGFRLIEIPAASGGPWPIEVRCDVLGSEGPYDISYRLLGRLKAGTKSLVEIEPIAQIPLTSDIAASLFAQDPITKTGHYRTFRPNRASHVLNMAKTPDVDIGPLPAGTSAHHVLLSDPVNDYVRVTNSPFVGSEAGLPPDDPKEVSKKALHKGDARTDDFAAINAYHHARDLFQRMAIYGLVPEDLFKFATLPLMVRYRSGMEPGPGRDGRLINAQARWSPSVLSHSAFVTGALIVATVAGEVTLHAGITVKIMGAGDVRIVDGNNVVVVHNATVLVRDSGDTEVKTGVAMAVTGGVVVIESPGQLEVCFALADLQSSFQEAPKGAPLGVACDARWCWHEFCHVLLAASTGELEFRFAHSAGDALGAIRFDPESALADSDLRHVTFPWVCWPCRRHDRKVMDGWSWTGPLYHRERYFDNGLSLKKAYWSEQILSSSLFRLYRALGGDSEKVSGTNDVRARRAASDYAVMLIMRAIQSMGPASAVPLLTVEKFVCAMKEADAATGTFETTIPALRRVGGVAQKPLRWAFEQQGLYRGEPPAVDVFVDDGRLGEYTPISMSGSSWHTPGAIEFEDAYGQPIPEPIPVGSAQVNIYVIVQNRGTSTSSALSVRVDVAHLKAGAVPDWLDAAWIPLAAAAMGGPVQPGGTVRVGPIVWPSPKRGSYAVFVAVSCAEDLAIVDPSSGLPCSTISSPMLFMVAGDNNLGLRPVTVA